MPPTSRRVILATTLERWRGTERPKAAPRSWPEAPRPGRRAGWPSRAWSSPLAPTAGLSRPWSWWICGGALPGRARSIRGRWRRSPRWPTGGPRRSCSSTAVGGRPSSPVGRAGAGGAARSATCHSSSTESDAHPGESSGWALRCHHCGHAEHAPASCPDCASVALARHGVGTERLATLLGEAAAPLPVFRLDSDSAAGVGGHLRILRRFDEAESGVLVGTQMVAKGHDFPDVVLSVVLDADATLRFPDFRAEERTFALVSQLAGRSGRGGAWREGPRPDAGPRRSRNPRCGKARRRGLPRGRDRAAPGAWLPAVLPPGADRALCTRGGAGRAGRRPAR